MLGLGLLQLFLARLSKAIILLFHLSQLKISILSEHIHFQREGPSLLLRHRTSIEKFLYHSRFKYLKSASYDEKIGKLHQISIISKVQALRNGRILKKKAQHNSQDKCLERYQAKYPNLLHHWATYRLKTEKQVNIQLQMIDGNDTGSKSWSSIQDLSPK